MRAVIREHVEIGVDNIKLSMSGEEVRALIPRTGGMMPRLMRQQDHRDPFCTRLLLHRRRNSGLC